MQRILDRHPLPRRTLRHVRSLKKYLFRKRSFIRRPLLNGTAPQILRRLALDRTVLTRLGRPRPPCPLLLLLLNLTELAARRFTVPVLGRRRHLTIIGLRRVVYRRASVLGGRYHWQQHTVVPLLYHLPWIIACPLIAPLTREKGLPLVTHRYLLAHRSLLFLRGLLIVFRRRNLLITNRIKRKTYGQNTHLNINLLIVMVKQVNIRDRNLSHRHVIRPASACLTLLLAQRQRLAALPVPLTRTMEARETLLLPTTIPLLVLRLLVYRRAMKVTIPMDRRVVRNSLICRRALNIHRIVPYRLPS